MNYDDAPFHPSTRPRGRRWFVVQSRPRKESYAADNLERQGFETYVPRLKRTKRHARRSWTGLVPLFPRYFFVRLDLGADRWRAVHSTYGVSCLLNAGTWPLPAPTAFVEELIAAGKGAETIDLTPALKPGEQVCFLTGPFAETIGRLVELDDVGRAHVLLELLGAQRKITVASTTLAPAGDMAAGR